MSWLQYANIMFVIYMSTQYIRLSQSMFTSSGLPAKPGMRQSVFKCKHYSFLRQMISISGISLGSTATWINFGGFFNWLRTISNSFGHTCNPGWSKVASVWRNVLPHHRHVFEPSVSSSQPVHVAGSTSHQGSCLCKWLEFVSNSHIVYLYSIVKHRKLLWLVTNRI